MAVVFVITFLWSCHGMIHLSQINKQFLTIYVCEPIFRPFTEDVFKWITVDVYIGGNEHGMYPVSNLKNIMWNRQASNAAFTS